MHLHPSPPLWSQSFSLSYFVAPPIPAFRGKSFFGKSCQWEQHHVLVCAGLKETKEVLWKQDLVCVCVYNNQKKACCGSKTWWGSAAPRKRIAEARHCCPSACSSWSARQMQRIRAARILLFDDCAFRSCWFVGLFGWVATPLTLPSRWERVRVVRRNRVPVTVKLPVWRHSPLRLVVWVGRRVWNVEPSPDGNPGLFQFMRPPIQTLVQPGLDPKKRSSWGKKATLQKFEGMSVVKSDKPAPLFAWRGWKEYARWQSVVIGWAAEVGVGKCLGLPWSYW